MHPRECVVLRVLYLLGVLLILSLAFLSKRLFFFWLGVCLEVCALVVLDVCSARPVRLLFPCVVFEDWGEGVRGGHFCRTVNLLEHSETHVALLVPRA